MRTVAMPPPETDRVRSSVFQSFAYVQAAVRFGDAADARRRARAVVVAARILGLIPYDEPVCEDCNGTGLIESPVGDSLQTFDCDCRVD